MARILAQSQERYETRYALKARGVDLKDVAARVAELLGMQAEQVWQAGKTRPQVKAQLAVLLGGAGVGREHDGHGPATWHIHGCGEQSD